MKQPIIIASSGGQWVMATESSAWQVISAQEKERLEKEYIEWWASQLNENKKKIIADFLLKALKDMSQKNEPPTA